jgi:hypothetical protein
MKTKILIISIILVVLIVPLLVQGQVSNLKEGDLVRTSESPALYLIQNGQKKVFPHPTVYLSWGLPEDFSTVKTVDDLRAYPEGEPVSFRDGSLFRGKTTSLYGQEASAVFFVSNGKLRTVQSSAIYQALFHDPDWKKVVWLPDDLLDKFAYPMGEMISSSETHPDGTLIRYKGSLGIYLIEAGKKRPITSLEIFNDNRLNLDDVIEIEPSETYETGPAVQPEEDKLTLKIPNAVKNTTFVKTYRFYDSNNAWGIWQTRDNHYLLSGTTLPRLDKDAYISKLNQRGESIWTKLVGSKVHFSGPMGKGPADDKGYFSVQLKDGSYLLAGQTYGYVGDKEAEIYETPNDVFLSKFDQQGKHLWTETVGDLAGDTPVAIRPTDDNGFVLLLTLEELGAGAETVGDTDHYFALIKFNAEGQKEWIKKTNLNTGGTMGVEAQVNFFIEREDDGGFVLLGVLPSKEVSRREDEGIVSSMPVVVKIDKNANIVWAKSLESIPQEYQMAKPTADGKGYTMDYVKFRIEAGNFSAVQRAPDKGYLVFGYVGALTLPSFTAYNPTWDKLLDTPLLAVKLDKNGNFKWAKTIKTGLRAFGKAFFIAKTKDNDFILMADFLPAEEEFKGEKYDTYMKKAEAVWKLCQSLNCKLGDEETNPALKQFYEEMNKAQDEWAATFKKHIALIKIDPEFNVKWVKKIGPKVKPVDIRKSVGNPYEFNGNDIKIAQDGGILIAGTHDTDVVCSVRLGIKYYCKDALFIKLDANGNLTDNSAGLVSDYTSISQEDLSQYITIRDVEPKIVDYELGMGIKRQKPNVLARKARTITTLSSFKEKTVIPTKQSLSSLISPVAPLQPKTWAERSYESVKEVGLVNEKSREIHNELLPILNQLFNQQVKLRDNFGGITLDYIFGRLVTIDDMAAVKNYLEGVGYKDTDLSSGGKLVMTKIGLTLNLSFAIKDRIRGTLGVTW